MSALPPKADIEWRLTDVCFVPIADIQQSGSHQKKTPGHYPGFRPLAGDGRFHSAVDHRPRRRRQSFAVIERPYGITARITPANSKPATETVVKTISATTVTILAPQVIFPSPLIVGTTESAGVGARISPTVQGSGATRYRYGKILPLHDSPPRVHGVCFGSKADMMVWPLDVHFIPESRHPLAALQCPLNANSGHSQNNAQTRKTASRRSLRIPIAVA
jgi:hypothetical protein